MVDDSVIGGASAAVELVGNNRGDALVCQRADRYGSGRDQLGAFRIEILGRP
ncbi:hypothetical protein [Bradyrhizobium sp. USDA 4506]